MAIRPVIVEKQSPFLGEACALCKEPIAPGDELVICPQDGARHHVRCWQAYGNRCSAYGCTGSGEVLDAADYGNARVRTVRRRTQQGDVKVQTLPERSISCAQSCLLVTIAIAIILCAIGCFGLWAIADYVLVDVLGWQYRDPIASLLPLLDPEMVPLIISSIFLL
jgi:hypothetical protein